MREALAALVAEAEAGFSGRLALAFAPLPSGEPFLHEAERPLPAASLIKLPLLLHALAEVAAGRLSLERRVALREGDKAGGNGVLRLLGPGLEPSVRDLLTLMIALSDNTATNLVIDLLGLEAANAFMQRLGLARTRLVGKLQLPLAAQNEAQRRGERNQTSAAEVLGLLVRLARGELLGAAETELALAILREQQYHEALGRYLPRDPELSDERVVLASKSGCLRGVWHDAALVCDARHRPLYALVVMTADSTDQSYGYDQEGMLLIARLARAIHRLVCERRSAAA